MLCLFSNRNDDGTAEMELLFDPGVFKQHVSFSDGTSEAAAFPKMQIKQWTDKTGAQTAIVHLPSICLVYCVALDYGERPRPLPLPPPPNHGAPYQPNLEDEYY